MNPRDDPTRAQAADDYERTLTDVVSGFSRTSLCFRFRRKILFDLMCWPRRGRTHRLDLPWQ